jgi:EpsD family peptidyl-prolyl cis-trans isomerase
MSIDHRPASSAQRAPTHLGLLLVCALALAGCGRTPQVTSPPVAKVNQDEVRLHHHDFLMQQQRAVPAEQQDALARQQLERLIDQQLALQKAATLKLVDDPRVLVQLEMARRDALVRAYIEKIGEAAPKPTADEVRKFFEERPALFSQRRVYNLQEIVIEARPEQGDDLRARLVAAKSIDEFVAYLKSSGLRFAANQAVRAAEQLPAPALESIKLMQDGQAMMLPAPNGFQVVSLAGSRNQPVTLEQAQPVIEQQLLAERRAKLVADDLKALRAAAKIEYLGKFASAAASAPAK